MTKSDLLLENAVRLADHHRKTCEGAECDISLSLLLELLRRAGIEVPANQVRRFL